MDSYGAHDRLVMAYFSDHPQYDESTFRERFRISRRLFTKIVREVTDASPFFQQTNDCTGKVGISSLMKCTSAIRQMAYGAVPDSLDEYQQMEFLRKLTYSDMEKLYAHHDEMHGFPRMLGSIDCTHWPWANCPVTYTTQFSRGTNDHKRILYKTKHEATRKDMELAFGVLKTKWKLIKYPARGMSRRRISDVMYTCIILHNMIIHDNGEAISPIFFPEEQHRDGDPIEDTYHFVLCFLSLLRQSLEGDNKDEASSTNSKREHSLVWRCFEKINGATMSTERQIVISVAGCIVPTRIMEQEATHA
ncbi:ALP1-like protein [Tanacetum coccineum]